ncbi:MAG: HAMP domain-containing sensor histidine kinase [Myxococcota bacterium]
MKFNSITVPIVLGAASVALSISLLVGWILVLIQNIELASEAARANAWMMVAGIASFVVIVTVLVLFSVFLVREILEGRRQVRFIDSVTHELKSPLASLKLSVQTLNRPQLGEEHRHDLQQRMLDDIDRLNTFIDDILSASRVGYGPAAPDLRPVNLSELIDRVVEQVNRRYRLSDGAIVADVDPDLKIETTPTALETVLKNLLDNAVKYSTDRIEVGVRATVKGDRVLLEISDKGIGIPPTHIGRIFERFYRVPTEAVHTRKGTGLGLYVVQSLVRSLGGTLRAESAGEDRGTTMRFDLPRGYPG